MGNVIVSVQKEHIRRRKFRKKVWIFASLSILFVTFVIIYYYF